MKYCQDRKAIFIIFAVNDNSKSVLIIIFYLTNAYMIPILIGQLPQSSCFITGCYHEPEYPQLSNRLFVSINADFAAVGW
jgi:hypothetical protein